MKCNLMLFVTQKVFFNSKNKKNKCLHKRIIKKRLIIKMCFSGQILRIQRFTGAFDSE